MSLRAAIRRARQHVENQGLPVTLHYGPELTSAQFEELLSRAGDPPIPQSVIDVYSEIGDGFHFEWQEPDAHEPPFDDDVHDGKLEFPTLATLVERRSDFANAWWASEDFAKSGYRNPDLAQEQANRMVNWTWFVDEGNGDKLCIDFATEEVVYFDHTGICDNIGENGTVMASDLREFLIGWSSVCFAGPGGQFWPDAFTDDGIDWGPEYFGDRYQVP